MLKRTFLLLVLSFSVVDAPQAAVDREQSQALYEQALEYFREESYPEATIQLRNALQQDPDNLPARIMLGRALLTQNQPLAAIKELEKAQALGGDENLILVPLALSYLELAQPEHVITGFVAEGHKPDVDGELLMLQGEASLQLGDTKRAEELFVEAATLMPVDPRPTLGRARIQVFKGKREQAHALVAEAIALAPESTEVWTYNALMLRDEGDFAAALKAFERVLELDPTSSRALTARAALWLDLGEDERADADLLAVSNLGSDSLESIYLRTLILYRKGLEDEARDVLRQSADDINAIREDARAKLPETILMLGVVAYFDENYVEAVTNLQLYLNRFPGHLGARRYLASAYLKLGDAEAVVKLLKPSTSAEPPPDPMLLSVLAEAYRSLGNHAAAETYFGAALKVAPDVAGIGVRLAATRLDAGRPEAAIEELTRLTVKFPELVDAWIQLVRVYVKTSDAERARATLVTMLERFPDKAQVHNVAGASYLALGDFEQAQLQLELARDADRTLLLPQINLARLAAARGETATAEAQYRSVLEQFKGNTVAAVELTRLLIQNREYEEAMARIDAVLKSTPRSFEAQELRLRVMYGRRDPPQDIGDGIFTLLETFPEEPRAEFLAGRLYRYMGNLTNARLHLRRAVEKAGFDAAFLFDVANQQYAIGDYRNALWTLTKAEQGAPGKLGIAVLKASTHISLGEHDRAREVLDALEARFGEHAAILTVRGDLAMAEKQVDKGVEAYKAAFAAAPAADALRTQARAMIVARQYDAADAAMKQWLAQHPDDVGTRHLQAQMHMLQKRWPEARDAYERLRGTDTADPGLLNNLAVCYQHLQDERALAVAEAAYKLAPTVPDIADTYGWILLEQGKHEEALALLREAYARSSTNPTIRYHIGLALHRLGRDTEAREEIEAALASGTSFSALDEATSLLDKLR